MPAAELDFPRKLKFLFRPSRYKVAYGGRGSGKSWGFARALLIMAMQRPLRILCARELQMSIQESVHRLLADQIDAMGLQAWYEVQQATIHGRNGSQFIFSGIRSNPTKIKSTEAIDICWIEEAEKVSERSWEVLIPTIRKPGSEIWVSFNPDEKTDPTYKRFVLDAPPQSLVREVTWHDNPWFPEELRAEKDYLARVDPEAYAHVWGGKCRTNSNAQILRGKYRIETFEPNALEGPDPWDGPYFGADWGFATDPTVLVKLWIHNFKLYVEYEVYGIGVELDDIPEMFRRIPGSNDHVIRADNSRPETISHVARKGNMRIEGAPKWPGSVEDGIAFLRSFEAIVIHTRCTHAAEEARLWSYKTDRLTGDVLPEVKDGFEHCWDSVRYGISPLIQNNGNVWERLGDTRWQGLA
jgi:phage terminase large subunit